MNRGSVLIWVGLFLAIAGALLSFSCRAIYELLVRKELPISPSSKTFPLWQKSTIQMNIYLFNWTNPEQLMDKDFKPEFKEIGPYSFQETYEKVNLTWNSNNTVTYKRLRTWRLDPENTKADLNENITTLNVVTLSASFLSRNWNFFRTYAISTAVSVMGKSLVVTRPAKEFLFEGYDDPLVRIAHSMPSLFGTKVPGRKVGWFYNRNDSYEVDGIINVGTAADDITKQGMVRTWDYTNKSHAFLGKCGEVQGSVGDLFPPKQTKDKTIVMFTPDLCRSFELNYFEETHVHDLLGYRYEASKTLMDNGTTHPDTRCNCDGECMPAGVFNLSSCRYGMPAFMSYPHFYDADPSYLRAVKGLKPDAEKHKFHITIEPNTGIPLELQARLQLNLRLQPNKNIRMYRDVPTILFPVLWFEETATLPKEEIPLLKLLLMVPVAGPYLAFGMMLIGIVILAFIILPRIFRTNNPWNLPHRIKGKSSEMTQFPVAFTKRLKRASLPEKEEVPKIPEECALLDKKPTPHIVK